MHVLIDINKTNKPIHFLKLKHCKLSFIALNKDLKKEVSKSKIKDKIFSYPGVTNSESCLNLSIHPNINYDSQVELIVNDYRLMSMYERSYKFPISNSLRVADIIYKIALINKFIDKEEFTHYAIYATPHNIDNWIFSMVFKLRGLEVIYLQESILSWRYYLISEKKSLLSLNKPLKFNDSHRDKNLLNQYKSKYQDINGGMASYVKRDIENNNGKIYNFWKDFRDSYSRPDLFVNKYRCYKAYNKIVRESAYDTNKPFIYFPLHDQPERSTLPEGGRYTSQFRAIFYLASVLPDEVNIFIKEHPSTFFYQCHWLERSPSWYKKLNSIAKVKFLPIQESNTTLIDNSLFTASINGTVASESVLRNKNVILFSKARYLGYESELIHIVKDSSKLERLVTDLLVKSASNTLDAVLNENDIYERTFSSEINSNIDIDYIERNWCNYREEVWLIALSSYLNDRTVSEAIE